MGNTLREIQLCELGILKEISRVCEKHGLRYYLCGGTLLGAVRHKGMIPWDDDIDVIMPLADYKRFLAVAQEELGDGFFVQTAETDPWYALPYAHIRKNGTAMLLKRDLEIPSHHGVWVDLFPLIYLRNDLDYKLKRSLIKVCYYLRMNEKTYEMDKERFIRHSSRFTVGLISLIRKLPLQCRNRLRAWLLRRICAAKKGKYRSYLHSKLSKPYLASFFGEECVRLEFEGEYYPVPTQYEAYLRLQYGDYMTPPPPEKRVSLHGDYEIVDLERDWTYYCSAGPDAGEGTACPPEQSCP